MFYLLAAFFAQYLSSGQVEPETVRKPISNAYSLLIDIKEFKLTSGGGGDSSFSFSYGDYSSWLVFVSFGSYCSGGSCSSSYSYSVSSISISGFFMNSKQLFSFNMNSQDDGSS